MEIQSTKKEIDFTTQKPPKNWLVESILVTMFCCMPFGIAGIVNASKVEARFYAGDLEGANRASKEAGKWTKIGFIIFIVGMGLYVMLMLGIVLFAAMKGDF